MEDAIKEENGKKTAAIHKKGRARRIVGRVIEIAILTVVIAAVWGLFSLPSVFFFMNKKVSCTCEYLSPSSVNMQKRCIERTLTAWRTGLTTKTSAVHYRS